MESFLSLGGKEQEENYFHHISISSCLKKTRQIKTKKKQKKTSNLPLTSSYHALFYLTITI